NCWTHHNGAMGIGSHGQTGTVIERNLIEFNGCHIQFHHGVYASGDGLTIRGNIVRHNAGYGLHLYSSIKNSLVANNLVYGHAHKPGIIVACADDGGSNVVVNNTVVSNNVAVSIWRPSNELLVNNIIVANTEIASVQGDETKVVADYNLCVPESQWQGPHGITADPMFVAQGRGVYWLQPGSPAIGRGAAEHAPATDFWGQPRAADRAPDLGAFAFVPLLATDEARGDWYYGWAYRRTPGGDREVPDLWSIPPTVK
ncbi:MAG: right-handed parallel beta-helix repeat-containing protein, partial [Armatimonadota bacterium]